METVTRSPRSIRSGRAIAPWRRAGILPRRAAPTWLLATGLLLWLAAQALPAYSDVPLVRIVTVAGGLFGVAGMVLFPRDDWGGWMVLAWTANVWLLAALVARRLGRRCALAFAVAALLCSLAAVPAVMLGPGVWLWIASLVLVTLSTLLWVRRPDGQPRREIPHRTLDEAMARAGVVLRPREGR